MPIKPKSTTALNTCSSFRYRYFEPQEVILQAKTWFLNGACSSSLSLSTGTPPRNLRLHFPYAPPSEELLVKINYNEPNRLYVYLEGTGRINPVTSAPQLEANGAHGSYYWEQASSTMWVLLKGGQVSPEIRTEPVIMVRSFSMSAASHLFDPS